MLSFALSLPSMVSLPDISPAKGGRAIHGGKQIILKILHIPSWPVRTSMPSAVKTADAVAGLVAHTPENNAAVVLVPLHSAADAIQVQFLPGGIGAGPNGVLAIVMAILVGFVNGAG